MHFIQFMINVRYNCYLFALMSSRTLHSLIIHHIVYVTALMICYGVIYSQLTKKRPSASGLEFIGPLVSSVEETPDPICTVIKGQIPFWITGSFLRNGPGKFEFGESK